MELIKADEVQSALDKYWSGFDIVEARKKLALCYAETITDSLDPKRFVRNLDGSIDIIMKPNTTEE